MIDVNKPLENPNLKTLFERFASEPSETLQNEIIEEILTRAHFLSLVNLSQPPTPNDDGTAVFQQDTTISYFMLSAQDGSRFYPAFSDWGELRKFKNEPNMQTIIMRFDDYAKMVLDTDAAGLVVDPFGANFVFNREWITYIMERKNQPLGRQIKVKKEQKVLLGEPREYPAGFCKQLTRTLENIARVRRAWLMLMIRSAADETNEGQGHSTGDVNLQNKAGQEGRTDASGTEQSFLLVVDFTGERDEVFNKITQGVGELLGEQMLDMIPLDSDFGRKAANKREPFFERKKGLFSKIFG